MRHEHGSSVIFQCSLYHLPWIDLRMVDGAGEESFVRNQPVLVIEEERGKLLALQCGKLQAQPVTY